MNTVKTRRIGRSSFLSLVSILCAVVGVSTLASGCSMQQEPCCASFPIKPFKAVYEYKAGDSPATKQTWFSDGKGKVVTSEGASDSSGVSTLVDYATNESTVLDSKNKTAQAVKLATPWISNGTCEETNATILGAKTIDGHPCKGWKLTGTNGDSEYWLGEDTGCYVLISSALPDNKTAVLKLIDYQSAPAEHPNFDLPKDYKTK